MREPSLQELLNNSFSYNMNNIHTAIPAIVVTVRNDLEDMTLDVQPTLNIKNKNGSIEERPVVLNVPFQFPSSSTAAFTFPINVGDSVLLIFSMRGLDTWKRGTGRQVTPTDFRKFDKKDCFAIPGIHTISNSINDPQKRFWPHSTLDAVLVNNIGTGQENEVRLKASGDVIVNTQQNVEVNCNNATVTAQADITLSCTNLDVTSATATFDIANTEWLGNINLTGNILQTGNYTINGTLLFNGIDFSTHKHTGVQAGIDTSGGPVA